MNKPLAKGFAEKKFFATFEDLIKNGKLEPALTFLLDSLPGLHAGKMNRKEKLKQLVFAGRMLQNAGLGKHGYRKLQGKVQGLKKVLARYPLASRGTFVDFGCGAHEPLGLAAYFYLNGFERAIANDFLPPRDPTYSAFSMYDILANMRLFPERYLIDGVDRDAFIERIGHFDIEAFENGDFEGGVRPLDGKVAVKSCDIVEAGIEPGSVSFLVSFAVFEHVMDMAGVTTYLYNAMKPGGLSFHYIDLADHRAYRADGEFNEFSFLTEEEAPGNVNRLRKSEQVAAFKAAGFDVLEVTGQRIPIPEETHKRFLPRWAEMSPEDQDTRGLRLVLRRPETV